MRKYILLLLVVILLLQPGFALKGVGIVYSTSATTVSENEYKCFTYGVYNPWDEDVKIVLTVEGELADLNPVSENIDVPAGTSHSEAKQVEICFDIPKVYGYSCPAEQESFKGKIVATEYYPAGFEGTGSSTSTSVSAPLELKVACVQKEGFQFDTQLFMFGGIIVGILVAIYLGYSFFKTHKIVKKK